MVSAFSRINICLTFRFAHLRAGTGSLIATKHFNFCNIFYLGTRIRKNLEIKI